MRRWCALVASAACPAGTDGGRARRVLGALGARLDAPREPLAAPTSSGTLIVANHRSWLDIVAVLALEPVGFLAKQEVAGWPLIGPAARRLRTVFVDRWSLRALPGSVAELAATLRRGQSVLAFPEATTWCGGHGGGPFRRAPFQAALDAGAPIRPVTFTYSQDGRPSTVADFVGEDSLAASVRRVLRARDLAVHLRAHPLLAPVGDRRELAALAQQAVTTSRSTAAHV
jgi:1-acyl-sn-glycerol-3-phosphate acyltransferase